jgi:hypothetical protein
MDINDEKEIGRRFRELAREYGFELPPDGFRLVPNLDDDTIIIHAICVATEEMVEAALARQKAEGGDEQVVFDNAFAEIEQQMKRDELREQAQAKADAVRNEIIDSLKKEGDGFL